MTRRKLVDVELDHCERCACMFFDHETIEQVLDEPTHLRTIMLLALRASPPPRGSTPSRCPACTSTMTRMSDKHAGISFDACRAHGVCIDVTELATMVEYVRRKPGYRLRRPDERENVGNRAVKKPLFIAIALGITLLDILRTILR